MSENIAATNRKARRDYHIISTMEAGIELKGTEVKSLRAHKVSLNESFAVVDNGQVFIYNLHISPYEFGNINNVSETRPRRLLLHKNQIADLYIQTKAKGNTLIPLSIYFKKGLAKIELALAKGKKLYDKREDIKKREADIEMKRAIRGKNSRNKF